MKNFFFSHPIEASLDPRMEAMEEKLHGKGAGVYWYIREKMSFFSKNRCRLKQLKPFATKYFTYRLMEQVVLETDLFDIDGDVITPRKLACELDSDTEQTDTQEPENPSPKPRKTTAKNDKNTTKNSKKTAVSDENRTKNDENPAKNNGFSAKNEEKSVKNDGKSAKNEENPSKNSEKTAKNEGKTAENSGKQPLKPLQETVQPAKEEAVSAESCAKSNTNTSTIYKEREKEREKATTTTTAEAAEAAEEKSTEGRKPAAEEKPAVGKTTGNPPKPVLSWRQYVERLGTDSQWVEIACMKSGFGALLMSHFEYAKELFCQHVIAFGKSGNILSQEDAINYFMCFATHPVTSKRLRQKLLEMEQTGNASPGNPYRHEQRQNGYRTYNGRRIPADAPPRPDDHSLWNDRLKRWEPEF